MHNQQNSRPPATVNELIDRYLTEHAPVYYQSPPDRNGERTPTDEPGNLRCHLRFLREVAGEKPPAELRCEDLIAAQQWMLRNRQPNGEPYARKYINKCINSMRRCVSWATEPPQRWLSIDVLIDLKLCKALKYGRTDAAEPAPRKPVPRPHWQATLEACAMLMAQERKPKRWRRKPGWPKWQWPKQLQMAIELASRTGMRPQELLSINEPEIREERVQLLLGHDERRVKVYSPWQWKCRYQGFDRNIFLNEEAQTLLANLRPYQDDSGHFFSWTVSGLGQALRRVNRMLLKRQVIDPATGCVFTPPETFDEWCMYQLRHWFGTEVRRQSGLDAAQTLLGHRHASTSEIYAKVHGSTAVSAVMDLSID